jgi:hypothetical protein
MSNSSVVVGLRLKAILSPRVKSGSNALKNTFSFPVILPDTIASAAAIPEC